MCSNKNAVLNSESVPASIVIPLQGDKGDTRGDISVCSTLTHSNEEDDVTLAEGAISL